MRNVGISEVADQEQLWVLGEKDDCNREGGGGGGGGGWFLAYIARPIHGGNDAILTPPLIKEHLLLDSLQTAQGISTTHAHTEV